MIAIHLTRKAVGLVAVGLAAVTVTLISGVAGAWKYGDATVTEYVQLPKFCWAEYGGAEVEGPEYRIPESCGVGTNHYCWGLLDLQRSKKAPSVAKRRDLLEKARSHTTYTMDWMKRTGTAATCPITPHVEGTMREIQLQFKIYGMK